MWVFDSHSASSTTVDHKSSVFCIFSVHGKYEQELIATSRRLSMILRHGPVLRSSSFIDLFKKGINRKERAIH